MARRYHWHSAQLKTFHEEPHTYIYGQNQGEILNLTHHESGMAKSAMMEIVNENPEAMVSEIQKLLMPRHHEVRNEDVNLKRLGAMLVLAHEREIKDIESLLLLEGVGPRTVQSLALVSEIIHGAPSRFEDPARFSFAHGGKDGHPFPVPTKTYDETIEILRTSVEKSKIGHTDKKQAIKNLSIIAQDMEKDFYPEKGIEKVIAKERAESYKYGGRTVFGKSQPPFKKQLSLFDDTNDEEPK
jgi:hypothetical protein